MANVLFGKLGQDIVFDRNLPEAIRSNTNGNYEAYGMLSLLLGTGHNILCTYDNVKISYEQQLANPTLMLITDAYPKINVGLILLGVDESKVDQKLLEIINSGIKWFALCTDPRCLNALSHLITNPPRQVFAGVHGQRVHVGGRNFVTKYINLEAANIFNRHNFYQKPKHDKLVVVVNETSGWDRISNVLEMTSLIDPNDVSIYGRVNAFRADDDVRLKGEKPIGFIHAAQELSKVSYVAPIQYDWVTAKYLECIVNGVVPLLHPTYAKSVERLRVVFEDYDLYVNTSRELKDKYEAIISNTNWHSYLITCLRNKLLLRFGPNQLTHELVTLIGVR